MQRGFVPGNAGIISVQGFKSFRFYVDGYGRLFDGLFSSVGRDHDGNAGKLHQSDGAADR